MKKAPNPREVIGGKRFKCHGKVCIPNTVYSYFGEYARCKYCSRPIKCERQK